MYFYKTVAPILKLNRSFRRAFIQVTTWEWRASLIALCSDFIIRRCLNFQLVSHSKSFKTVVTDLEPVQLTSNHDLSETSNGRNWRLRGVKNFKPLSSAVKGETVRD
jgi:hypothetical protein